MGEARFDAVIQALWADLGLPARRSTPRRDASLTVDGTALTLALAPDEGNVVVSTALGALDGDVRAEADQLRRLLREGCGLILNRRAAIRLRPDGARQRVEVQALAPCRVDALRDVVGAIEDVLFVAEIHRPTLAASPAPRASALSASDLAGSLIFRL